MNLLDNWKTILDTATLAIVVCACVIHYTTNLDKHSHYCEVAGFVLTGAGAFGSAVYMWTTVIEPFDFELLMHVGLALIAVSLVYGRVRGWLASQRGMRWVDRRERT